MVDVPWRSAAQPDIVRAAQKDDLYLQLSVESCQEAVRRVFGAVPALQYARESKLLATLLYHGLTTGAGLQTLGEEYCDIMQMQGGTHAAPATVRAGLALLKSFGPYIGERLTAGLNRGAWESYDVYGDEGEEGQHPEASSSPRCQAPAPVDASTPAASLPQLARQCRAAAEARWQAARQRLAGSWPALQGWIAWAARVHLALFYLYGTYYQASHRLLRMRYITISSLPDRRASYRVLGMLLAAQLAVAAAGKAQPHVARVADSLAGYSSQSAQPQRAVVLPEQPVARPAAGAAASSSAHAGIVVESVSSSGTVPHRPARQCPLCLSPRSNPTCTPCGHVFCWHCIVQWCNEKPECPLCRMGAAASQLVALAHYADS